MIHDKSEIAFIASIAIVVIALGIVEALNYINTGSFESWDYLVNGTIHEKNMTQSNTNFTKTTGKGNESNT